MPMHRVIKEIDRPDRELVSKFRDIPTAVLSDVTTKYENTMASYIKPVYEPVSICGSALTVKAYPGDNLIIHKAVTMAEPGDVLIIDANGYTESGLWGDLISMSCKEHGLNGTVIDGAARDVDEIEELDYPVYSRAISPKGSYKAHPGSINTPISCGGVSVTPGDIVVGDSEGVVIIKRDVAEDVLYDARHKLDDEADLRRLLREGEYIYDLVGLDEKYQALNIEEIER